MQQDSLRNYVEWTNVVPENLVDFVFESLSKYAEEVQLSIIAHKIFPEVFLKCNQKTAAVLSKFMTEKQMYHVLRQAFNELKPFQVALVSELFRNHPSWKEHILLSTSCPYLTSAVFGDKWSKAKLRSKDLLKRLRLCQ